MGTTFWVSEGLKVFGLTLVAYLCGLLVLRTNIRVNYTRKINFFALFLIPLLVNYLVPYPASSFTTTLRTFLFIGTLALFARPIRERVPIVATMFSSYDRPEDRPYTLLWLTTQLLAGYLVVGPMWIYFGRLDLASLTFIPVLIHGLGDGFAEPVGVRFGKHKYSTWALFTRRKFTRSLEGSACIFVVGLLVVAAYQAAFTSIQFAAALLSVPTLMTLAEAVSPHTWDTPLMFLAGGGSLLAITQLL